MFRSIFGFAIFAVLAWLGLKIVFGILGGLIGLAMTILWLAALGLLFYLVLRVVSPSTAHKIRDMIKGRPADAQGAQGSNRPGGTSPRLPPSRAPVAPSAGPAAP